MQKNKVLVIAVLAALGLSGCANESSHTVAIEHVDAAKVTYNQARTPVSIGRFDNQSSYMRGVFSDNIDHLGNQAKTILITHLQQSKHFSVLDRDNMTEIKQESNLQHKQQELKGANYVITGDVSAFGRKQVGDMQLFGILGNGKSQIAYAKVNLNIVDTQTSEVVYSAQGAGEYALSNREVLGFGGTASYDSTLNGKVLDLAIRDAVNHLVSGIDSGAWKPAK